MRSIPFLSILLLAAGAVGAASQPAGRSVNAWQLLEIVETSLTETHRAAEAGGVDPRNRRFKPFWNAMDRAGRAVESVGSALRNRDQSFYSAVEQGSTALAELRVLWQRTGQRSPQVEAKLRLLLRSYRLLRTSYGAEQRRSARGGELSPAEAESFTYLQLLHGQLAERFDALGASSSARGDRATAADLERLAAEALGIAEAEPGVDSYLTSRIASDEMAGEWEGHRSSAAAQDAALWETTRETVEQLATDPEVGHVFALDLGDLGDWSHLETATFLPDEPEVQVFTPVHSEGEDLAAAGAEDGEIPGLFPPEQGDAAPAAEPEPGPGAAAPAAPGTVELPPMLATILLWVSLRFG